MPKGSRSKLLEALAAAEGGARALSAAHVMFILLASHTHIIPILPLMESLAALGVKVTTCSTMDGDNENDAPVVEKIRDTGSDYILLKKAEDFNPVFDGWQGVPVYFVDSFRFMPDALARARVLQPTLIAYDPFLGWAPAIARIIKVPSAGLLSFSGPGVFSKPDTDTYEKEEADEKVQAFLEWFRVTYEVELLDTGVWPMQFYSRDINIVACAEALSTPATDEFQLRRFAGCTFNYVGPLVDPRKARCDTEDFPLDTVAAAKNAGRSVILVALGTHISGPELWGKPLGEMVRKHCDGSTVNGRTLVESAGKDFCQYVFRTCMEAFGGRDEYMVVLATGRAEAPLEGVGVKTPANFLVTPFVPQLAVLPLCSAFVSHGGMGSINEAVMNRVPLIVVPVMGDQPANADNVAAAQIGFSFRYPYRTFNTDSLRSAAETLTDPGDPGAYRDALERLATSIDNGGGANGAANMLVGFA